jgi:hypothetical protein
MSLTYFLKYLGMVLVAPVITGITLIFTFHMCIIIIIITVYRSSLAGPQYCRIKSAETRSSYISHRHTLLFCTFSTVQFLMKRDISEAVYGSIFGRRRTKLVGPLTSNPSVTGQHTSIDLLKYASQNRHSPIKFLTLYSDPNLPLIFLTTDGPSVTSCTLSASSHVLHFLRFISYTFLYHWTEVEVNGTLQNPQAMHCVAMATFCPFFFYHRNASWRENFAIHPPGSATAAVCSEATGEKLLLTNVTRR